MNSSEKEMLTMLESMPLDKARIAIATRQFGDIGSPNHIFCSSWLAAKESDVRDAREEESLSISRHALSISESARKWAITAIVVSATTAIIVAVIQILSQKK
jgi:hypothetical protein